MASGLLEEFASEAVPNSSRKGNLRLDKPMFVTIHYHNHLGKRCRRSGKNSKIENQNSSQIRYYEMLPRHPPQHIWSSGSKPTYTLSLHIQMKLHIVLWRLP
jgi:hypothetical protein